MSPFNKLPLELLLRTTNHLSTTDICSFRLTCRAIEISLFNSFAREFFTKKQFMLTYSSLQVLVEISQSRMGDCLQHVIIGLDHYVNAQHNLSAATDSERAKLGKYAQGLFAQQALLDSGDAVQLLGQAFSELSRKRLQVVGIRDYASPARGGRDGSGVKWQSYGATTIRRETGVDLLDVNTSRSYTFSPELGRLEDFVTQVFRVVLLALGKVSATPASIEVLRHHFGHLLPSAFTIPDYQMSTIVPLLNKLETIFLPIKVPRMPNQRLASMHVVDPDTGSVSACPDHNIRVFLSHMSSLKHLRINMARGDATELQFLRWLGSPTGSQTTQSASQVGNTFGLPFTAKPASLPLVELNLGMCLVEPDTLLSIIRKFAPTLRRLELWKVTLAPFMEKPRCVTDGPNCIWPAFLRRVRGIPVLKLDHLMIGEPKQDCMPPSHAPQTEQILFRSLVNGGPPASFHVAQKRAYTGIDWQNFVKELEKDMHVIRITPDDSDGSDEDMDDDDDDDNEDDEDGSEDED